MRRTFSPSLALLAGFLTLLSGCAGESPTSPTGPGAGGGTGGTGGTCNVSISLAASSLTPLAGTAVVIRATLTKNGATVPDGQSVAFTTDFGFFAETGMPTVSKVIVSGVADVTLASQYSGVAHVKATFECGTAQTSVAFAAIPDQGPFISSISPASGSCAGGDTVTLNGGRFTLNGNTASTTRVTFGGAPATIVSVTDTAIIVKTPARALANPQVPEKVDVLVQINTGTGAASTATWPVNPNGGFTYACVAVNQRIFISSISPISGTPDGGTQVLINGGNFGTNIATTRVTFGGVAATITAQSDQLITVLSPRHVLANPSVPETVDVMVTRDLGLASQQSATLPQAYTYRSTGAGQCPTSPTLYISNVTPDQGVTGNPAGGEVLTINGGGFGSNAATTRVQVGGADAAILSISDTSIKISTPQHTLANPDVPETVDITVTVDVGGPNCATATLANAFTYTRAALTPGMFSLSPITGPNDVSTRVTLFGTGFQFPEQVFLTAGSCKVEAAVISITESTIIFQTPIASNGNACLANSTATVSVLNPQTGKGAPNGTYATQPTFRYYACPGDTAVTAVPNYGPYNQTTAVTITGQNFPEGVQAEWIPTTSGTAGPVQLVVSSVSASAVIVQMPAIDPLQFATGGAICSNLAGNIQLTFPNTNCAPITTLPFTYKIDAPQVTQVSPNEIPQAGGVTITVSGAFFSDPMTVVLTKNGAPLSYTQVNNAVVSNSNTLTFPAPAIRDTDMNVQACIPGGGTTPTGVKYVPTSFGVRVINAKTGCAADLPNALIYDPINTACRVAAAITGPTTMPAAVICSPYAATVTATGTGTLTYTLTTSGGVTGLSISGGNISGTPSYSTPGAGTASGTFTMTVQVTDSSVPPTTATQTWTVSYTDPAAPFAVAGPTTGSVSSATGGTVGPFTYSPATTGTVTWSVAVTPTPASGTITMSPATGATSQLTVPTGTTTGAYTATVTASDNCGHTSSQSVALTVGP